MLQCSSLLCYIYQGLRDKNMDALLPDSDKIGHPNLVEELW